MTAKKKNAPRNDVSFPIVIPVAIMPAGSQQYITAPRNVEPYEPDGLWRTVKRAANDFADATEAGVVGFSSGLTLGNFDEGMGAATAMVTLNPDNYRLGRNATRLMQQDLQQRHPAIYGISEFAGAAMSPTGSLTKLVTPSKIANATVDTLLASAGYAENWKDFFENLPVEAIANIAGLHAEKLPWGRAFGIPFMKYGRKPFKELINYGADKAKNWYYDDDE